MDSLLTFAAILLYLLASFLLAVRLFRRDSTAPNRWTPLAAAAVGVLIHGLVLYRGIFTVYGMDLAFFNMLALVAWVVTIIVLVATLTRPVETLGIFVLPTVALTAMLQNAFSTGATLVSATSVRLDAHILLSIIAYSLLSIAAVQAVLLAVQDHQLRHRHPGGFIRALPPLETMEYMLFQMIGAGYLLLTLSLLTGFIFLDDIFAQHLVHKTVLSILAWIVFAVLLWGRRRFGWRGRTAIQWTLGGFLALMLAYFGSKLVLELILGY